MSRVRKQGKIKWSEKLEKNAKKYFKLVRKTRELRKKYVNNRECLLTRLPHLKCITLGSVRSSHLPFGMHHRVVACV